MTRFAVCFTWFVAGCTWYVAGRAAPVPGLKVGKVSRSPGVLFVREKDMI
jgi:hypothetical protein